MKILLGTTSKYKKALFNKLGLSYESASPQFDELSFLRENSELPPRKYSEVLAQEKAKSLALQYKDFLIIAADQVCLMEEMVFHKSKNFEGALETLKELNGKTHQLFTSYHIIYKDQQLTHTNITNLTMHELDQSEIKRYIELDLPYDCAGSYKLESYGSTLFRTIETEDHHAIIGLPILKLANDLRKLGVTNFLGTHHE